MATTMIFDTETTSLVSNSLLTIEKQPRILEFVAFIYKGTKKSGEFSFLCDPGIEVPEEVTRITGLTTKDVRGQKPFADRIKEINTVMHGIDEVVAHNLSYDRFVVETEYKRAGKEIAWPRSMICTVEATEWYKGYRLSLGALHEHLFGQTFEGAHRAKADVAALARCFLELRKRGDV